MGANKPPNTIDEPENEDEESVGSNN